MPSLDPRGLIGRIYVGDHYTLLLTKLSFSHYKSIGANDPRDVASLGLRGLIGRIYVGDHLTMLHTTYVSCGPHGFREEDFF